MPDATYIPRRRRLKRTRAKLAELVLAELDWIARHLGTGVSKQDSAPTRSCFRTFLLWNRDEDTRRRFMEFYGKAALGLTHRRAPDVPDDPVESEPTLPAAADDEVSSRLKGMIADMNKGQE